MVNFKEIYHFSRFQRGYYIFQGGGGFFQGGGGVQLLIPYRNPYNLSFSRGGVQTPVPPLDPHLSFTSKLCVCKQRRLRRVCAFAQAHLSISLLNIMIGTEISCDGSFSFSLQWALFMHQGHFHSIRVHAF